jgi:hypothetical protein
MKKLFVILAAVGLVVAFTVPAMAAAEWSFYGSARMSTFWNDVDYGTTTTGGLLRPDDDGLQAWNLQGNSRIGAKVKAGDIGGRFEYGSGPNLRLLYGTWNFGAGTLLLGQDYTPTVNLISDQAYDGDQGLLNNGLPYAGRLPQIKLIMGGFQFAAVRPNIPATTYAVTAVDDTDYSLPKLEASYAFAFGPIKFKAFGGYQTYESIVAVAAAPNWTEYSTDIDSYIYGATAQAGLGPFYLRGLIAFGQNWDSYGFGAYDTVSIAPQRVLVGTTWTENDVDDWTFALIGGFKVNDMLALQAGYGYVESELDNSLQEDEAATYYIQAKINLAKGCFIVPEIGKRDFKDRKNAAGVTTKRVMRHTLE